AKRSHHGVVPLPRGYVSPQEVEDSGLKELGSPMKDGLDRLVHTRAEQGEQEIDQDEADRQLQSSGCRHGHAPPSMIRRLSAGGWPPTVTRTSPHCPRVITSVGARIDLNELTDGAQPMGGIDVRD